jgi:hypothetical protein
MKIVFVSSPPRSFSLLDATYTLHAVQGCAHQYPVVVQLALPPYV